MTEPEQLLQQYFGYPQFREGQQKAIDAILSHRDVLAVMPTGAGKSICYQIPALLLPGITLVISPLISLMQDQVAALQNIGFPAACIHSGMDPDEIDRTLRLVNNGVFRIVYIAPERLANRQFLHNVKALKISMIAVDEAHCISHWGHDFRPSYLQISDFIEKLPERPICAAFTATATPHVAEDIVEQLRLNDPVRIKTGFDRENLYFSVIRPRNKKEELLEILRKRQGKSGIIYCSTRKYVDQICEMLVEKGVSAARYHAGLSDGERKKNQDDFIHDRISIMVATNAFGMGIDKPNVSFVIHYNIPGDLESYYQEAGRAGRDGAPAECILFYASADLNVQNYFIRQNYEDNIKANISEEECNRARQYAKERLNQMIFYARSTTTCLRGQILRYFGENPPERCNNCSACRATYNRSNDTIQKKQDVVLSPPKRTNHQEELLLQTLKRLRSEIAGKKGIPPYFVFSDLVLQEIAHTKPRTRKEMLAISGISEAKEKRYGKAFRKAIKNFPDISFDSFEK